MVCTDLSGSRQDQVADCYESSCFVARGISWTAERLAAFQDQLCSMQFIISIRDEIFGVTRKVTLH